MQYKIIPESYTIALESCLLQVFNTKTITSISLLSGGYSNSLNYKITLNNKFYVLRLMNFEHELADRQQQVNCLQIAAANNIAPHCYFADAQTGIIISDYIEQQSRNKVDYNDWLSQIAILLQQLHQLPIKNINKFDLFIYMNDLIHKLKTNSMAEIIKDYLQKIQNIQAILAKHLTAAFCHNDLNSNNLLFDGQRNYFIDWEAAGVFDPYFDLAAITSQLISTEINEITFLNHYFGKKVTEYQQAKLYLMKQIAYCFYAIHFLMFAIENEVSIDNVQNFEEIPTIKDWSLACQNGKYTLQTAQDFLFFALVQIKMSLTQINHPKFQQATQLL